MILMQTSEKQCTGCLAVLPLDGFHRHSGRTDGRVSVCKACACAKAKTWRDNNIEDVRAKDRARQSLKSKDKLKEVTRKHYEKKHAYYRERVVARRAYMGQATPPWADKQAMLEVYEQAHWLRAIGVDVEVDHIVPLYGANVCGLHVHCNLRVVLKGENRSKGNRLDPALPAVAFSSA
jgi:hypothetical protein